MYHGVLHHGAATGVATIRDPIPGEPEVPHLEVGVVTDDRARAMAGLPQDSFERPFVLLPPQITGAQEWTLESPQYRGRFGTFDVYSIAVPLQGENAVAAALEIGVALGLGLFDQTFWLQSPKTNLTPGPSNIRGLAGVNGAQTPSGATVGMRQARVEDPGKSTLHFEFQDNGGIFGNAASMTLRVTLRSARRYQDGRVNDERTDRPMVELKRIGPNRYEGSVDFTHDGAQTADPNTSYSREIDRVLVLPIGSGVRDGQGDGVRLI